MKPGPSAPLETVAEVTVPEPVRIASQASSSKGNEQPTKPEAVLAMRPQGPPAYDAKRMTSAGFAERTVSDVPVKEAVAAAPPPSKEKIAKVQPSSEAESLPGRSSTAEEPGVDFGALFREAQKQPGEKEMRLAEREAAAGMTPPASPSKLPVPVGPPRLHVAEPPLTKPSPAAGETIASQGRPA